MHRAHVWFLTILLLTLACAAAGCWPTLVARAFVTQPYDGEVFHTGPPMSASVALAGYHSVELEGMPAYEPIYVHLAYVVGYNGIGVDSGAYEGPATCTGTGDWTYQDDLSQTATVLVGGGTTFATTMVVVYSQFNPLYDDDQDPGGSFTVVHP